MMVNRKGYFFVIDAFVGSAILFIAILVILNSDVKQTPIQYDYTISEEYSSFVLNTKLKDINNLYILNLSDPKTAGQPIKNKELTIVEQVDLFYYNVTATCTDVLCKNTFTNYSRDLIQNVTDRIVPAKYGFSYIIIDPNLNTNTLIYARDLSSLQESDVVLASRKVSFLQLDKKTIFGPILIEVKMWLK